jgi:hypothetical protein
MKTVCLLLLVVVLPLHASDQGLFASASLDFAASVSGISSAPAVSFWEALGTVGLGVQIRTIVGFQIWDVSVAPMALLKLGVFDLGLGVSFLVRQPPVPYYAFENGIAPAAMVGLSLPFLEAGPGKVVASVGAGFFPTVLSKADAGSGLFSGLAFIGTWWKIYLGIGYAFRL